MLLYGFRDSLNFSVVQFLRIIWYEWTKFINVDFENLRFTYKIRLKLLQHIKLLNHHAS